MSDLISTQEAVAKIVDTAMRNILNGGQKLTKEYEQSVKEAVNVVLNTTRRTAQPEIIRCGQCKYAEVADKEDAQDGYTCQFHRGSIWFSGSYCSWAERRTDESD